MKRRPLLWIIGGAVALHVVGFSWFLQMKPLPKARFEAPPNFGYKQITWVDQETGERTIEREIRVTTRLAAPGIYEARPKTEESKP